MAGDKDNRGSPEGSEKSLSSMPGISNENRPPPVNRITPTRDAYWFAHGGVEDTVNNRGVAKHADPRDAQLQKEREERVRAFQEQKEEERRQRLKELEESFLLARKHREQLEEERKRRIEEARLRENERRQQVEERKRQIWEAEQERKSAILRRNLEREARIEARRNAQRNSASFAFGSSTPRTFDLDLAALGRSGCPLMSSVSGRRSEERDFGSKRATSACSLDRKSGEDCMSWSMTSLSSSSRGRRRTDLTPTLISRERSITPHTTPRGNPSMRAVSMTRLDQLAQPRRRYYDVYRDTSSVSSTATTSPSGPRATSPSMSKSMCNLANNTVYQPFRRLTRAPRGRGGSNMSQSMMQLPGASPRINQKPADSSAGSDGNTNFNGKLRSAQSMSHLAIAPRLTRAARLRANALAHSRQESHTKSMVNLHKNEGHAFGRLVSAKDTSISPSRPQSAMSGKSEISATSSQASGIVLRPKPPAPRKPRPVSIAGTTVDRPSWNTSVSSERQSRLREQNATVPKTIRARSKEPENKSKPIAPPKKPVPPPKSAQVLAKARSHPVPTKDNLRKVKAPSESSKVDSSDNSESSAAQSTSVSKEPEPVSQPAEVEKSAAESTESLPSSPEKVVTVEGEELKEKNETEATAAPKEIFKPEVAEEDTKPQDKVEVPVTAESNASAESSGSKPRITSEEEARAALAEKRRLAREQAEREAELERQRQEELRRQEEERKRQEELEQKRLEEEQIRLAELHRKMEEEKLRRAIEEQEQREKEEKARREEEARLKAEKEEQERKAREEALRQRLELEEKLRKEEQERAERKRRVEQIMSRTRIRGSQSADALSGGKQAESSAVNPSVSEARKLSDLMSRSAIVASSTVSSVETTSVMSTSLIDNLVTVTSAAETNSHSQSVDQETAEQFDLLSAMNSSIKNGFCGDDIEKVKTSNSSSDLNCVPNRTSDVEVKVHTNGYSSHEDSCLTSSPEERSEKSEPCEGLLLDVQSATHSVANNLKKEGQVETSSQLIDIGIAEATEVSHNNNFMVNIDIVNSNMNSTDTFHAVSDNLLKKQENTITDLLS